MGTAFNELGPKLGPPVQAGIPEIHALLRTLPPDGGARLLARATLLKPQPGGLLWQFRCLLIRLSTGWQTYRLGCTRPDVPLTNNGSEQAIGRFTVRSRSVRGFERRAGVEMAMVLCIRQAA